MSSTHCYIATNWTMQHLFSYIPFAEASSLLLSEVMEKFSIVQVPVLCLGLEGWRDWGFFKGRQLPICELFLGLRLSLFLHLPRSLLVMACGRIKLASKTCYTLAPISRNSWNDTAAVEIGRPTNKYLAIQGLQLISNSLATIKSMWLN